MSEHHHHEDHPHVVNRNARYGLTLFVVYVLLYGGFMWLTVFRTEEMGEPVLGGLNLAIAYGFGLIGSALVLALIYMALCGRPVHKTTGTDGGARR